MRSRTALPLAQSTALRLQHLAARGKKPRARGRARIPASQRPAGSGFEHESRVVTRAQFGVMPDGTKIDALTLTNENGVELQAITLGGIITRIRTPDREGRPGHIVLGHDALTPYLEARSSYLGALIGRFANRIAGARFALDGRQYQLFANDGRNHLHGGRCGFDSHVWDAESHGDRIVFSRVSPDGEEAYPGRLDVTVTYALSNANELTIDYHASTSAPTIVNLTQHSYFNLAIDRDATISDHQLRIDSDFYTPVDAELIPTGELSRVESTPFDFRTLRRIGDVEYDHNWVLRHAGSRTLRDAVHLRDDVSGRSIDVLTTQPGLQFYSGNFLDGRIVGRGKTPYTARMGLCLETQHFPDSPHHPAFPSTVLRPETTFSSRTLFRFGIHG
jgi:aldose 1-epimerase